MFRDYDSWKLDTPPRLNGGPGDDDEDRDEDDSDLDATPLEEKYEATYSTDDSDN